MGKEILTGQASDPGLPRLGISLRAARPGMAVGHLAQLDLDRVPTRGLLGLVFELRANVSSYDACHVALAESLGCELVTADARLAGASGPRCAIRVLT